MNAANETYTRASEAVREQQHRLTVASAETAHAERTGQYFTLLLFGMFVILLLLGLWMGTVAFRTINTTQHATDDARLALNSLQNRVRSFDEQGAFGTADGPEGPAIVFTYKLDAGNYETRLYLYEGELVQELAFSTDPYLPMTATRVVETSTFSFSYENGLLTVTTDQGSVCVALRSEAHVSANAGHMSGESIEALGSNLADNASSSSIATVRCPIGGGEARAAQLLNVTPSEGALRSDLRSEAAEFREGGAQWSL